MQKAGFRPRWIIELGSGFDSVAETLINQDEVYYSELSGFRLPTTPGHSGVVRFLSGSKGGAFLFFGRSHLYEGSSPESAASVIRVALLLGVEGVVLCSACGSVSVNVRIGDIILFDDVIRFPLYLPRRFLKTQHACFNDPFSRPVSWISDGLSSHIESVADRCGVVLRRGVIAIVPGPCYETPAEVEVLRRLGVTAVTMSCEPALRLATRLEVKTVILGGVTNRAGGNIADRRITHGDVLETAASSIAPKVIRLIRALVGQ